MIDLEPKAPAGEARPGSTPQPKVLEAEPTWFNTPGGNLAFKKQQIITPELLQANHEARLKTEAEGELMHVAAIPTVVVEHWMRQGFDILKDRNIKPRDIVRRLKAEGLDKFLTTSKNV